VHRLRGVTDVVGAIDGVEQAETGAVEVAEGL